MLGESTKFVVYRRWLWDTVLLLGAFILAHQLRSQILPHLLPSLFPTGLYPLGQYLPLLALAVPLWAFLLLLFPANVPGRRVSLAREIAAGWGTVGLGVLGLAAVGYLFRLHFVSRPFLVLLGFIHGLLLSGSRWVERKTPLGKRLLAAPERVVLIVGTNPRAASLARILREHQAWGFRVLGFVGMEERSPSPLEGVQVVTRLAELPSFVEHTVVDEIMVAVPLAQLSKLENIIARCQEVGVRVRLALSPFPHLKPRVEVESLGDQAILTLSTAPIAPLPLFCKRVMDVSVALLGLALCLPLLPLVALAIKLDSPGPVFFKQWRCGLRGRRFVLYKLRTMVEGAEALKPQVSHLNVRDGPVFKAPEDPRITRVGRWLRRFSVDELPQLWNVLKGDMSVVGPRPPLPEEVAHYEPWQRRRLAMKPGLTCLWQVSDRTKLSFSQWMALDLAYIDSWSLGLDFKILARTIPAVLLGKGAT